MRASIAQVAKHANVSAMTVSRVIRGRKNQVNPETYERVMAAVRDLNYVPMQSVFQNRHVETSTIGYVPHRVNVVRDEIDSASLEGMCSAARDHGYDMLLMLRDEADWMANRQIVRFLDRRSDGFIILSPRCGEWKDVFELLMEQDLPVVVCYRRDVPEGMAWVDPDNETATRLAVGQLAAQGHKHIALLVNPTHPPGTEIEVLEHNSPFDHYDDIQREKYFCEMVPELCGADAKFEIIRTLGEHWVMFPETVDFLMARGITGVVCNDYTALQLWDHVDRAGLRVPEDLSISAIDNSPPAAGRGLTSVGFGYDQVGRMAVEAWVALKKGKPAAECCKVVPVHQVERNSVAAPRQS